MKISKILLKKTLYITTNRDNIIYYEDAYQVLSKQKNWGFSKFYLQNMKLGSQNVSGYYEGAYTGEVSASQLKELKVELLYFLFS